MHRLPRLQRITAQLLADTFGGHTRWYERRFSLLIEKGLVKKQARYFFGDLEAIGKALATDDLSDYTGREVA